MSLIVATLVAGAIMTTTSPDQKGHPEAAFSVIEWGSVDGQPIHLWTLDSGSGLRMRVTDYGTIITELHVPDRDGTPVDVVLGRPTVQDYVERTQYFGCTAGRCANRIGKGQFAIDGKAFQVTCNNGPNCLHGGAKGFDKVVWQGQASMDQGMPKLVFTYTSRDGEEGFPGTRRASATR